MMRNKIELIIFDWDGTLIDSQAVIVETVLTVVNENGLAAKTPTQIAAQIGLGINVLFAGLFPSLTEAEIDKLVTAYQKLYLTKNIEKIRLFPQVKEVLECFTSLKMAVVSNKSSVLMKKEMKILQVEHYFATILGSEDSQCLKPSACPILKVLAKLEVVPEAALMVGDMTYDVLSGKEAGVFTAAATYGIGKKAALEKTQPDYLLADINELMTIV